MSVGYSQHHLAVAGGYGLDALGAKKADATARWY